MNLRNYIILLTIPLFSACAQLPTSELSEPTQTSITPQVHTTDSDVRNKDYAQFAQETLKKLREELREIRNRKDCNNNQQKVSKTPNTDEKYPHKEIIDRLLEEARKSENKHDKRFLGLESIDRLLEEVKKSENRPEDYCKIPSIDRIRRGYDDPRLL